MCPRRSRNALSGNLMRECIRSASGGPVRISTFVASLVRKIILAPTRTLNVGRRSMQGAAARVDFSEGNRDHFHTKLVYLVHHVDLAGFHADGLGVQG
jgi:hypothetical protein